MRIDSFGHFSGGRSGGSEPLHAQGHGPRGPLVLTLSGPVLAVGLLMIGVPREAGFLVLAGWSLVQIPLGMVALQERRHRALADADATAAADLQAAGPDPVEAGADRAKDRLHEVRATVAGIGLTHRLLSDEHVPISGADRSRLERL